MYYLCLCLLFRVLPSTTITLISELQASGGFDAYGLEIQNLAPRGWAKINIFDHLHQVMCGRWKIPIRVLPMKPSLTPEQLNGVPQVRTFSKGQCWVPRKLFPDQHEGRVSCLCSQETHGEPLTLALNTEHLLSALCWVWFETGSISGLIDWIETFLEWWLFLRTPWPDQDKLVQHRLQLFSHLF